MWPVSDRFREVVAGTHRKVTRVVVLPDIQFVAVPVGGIELPVLGGDVEFNSLQDINGTIEVETPGDYWSELLPYGRELHASRGVDVGDGGPPEMVPLGYFRIDQLDQSSRPYGPVKVSGSDRMAQVIDARLLAPYDYPAGTTYRQLFEKLINGTPSEPVVGYGVYPGTAVPIFFEGMSGDATLPAGVVEDSIYEHLADLADAKGCILRFDRLGRLVVDQRDRAPGEASVHRIAPGEGGTLIRISRKISRKGVYNIAVAWGSDPEQPTGRKVAYNADGGPLDWRGPFGPVPIYFSSPVLRDGEAALAAAVTRLSRYRGLPEETAAAEVPNPALEVLDPITLNDGVVDVEHLVDRLRVPLAGDSPCEIETRVLNELPDAEDSSGDGGVQNPGQEPSPPPSQLPERTQAAQLILTHLQSGASYFEDWTWMGAPALVTTHNNDLLDAYGGDALDRSAAIDWLIDYIATHQGGGPPAFDSPAALLGLGVRNWGNLGVGFLPGDPLDEDGDGHTDFSQARLVGGLVLPDHFEFNPARTAARLTVPVEGGRTSNKTKFPRTEFREHQRNGTTKASWNAGDGRHLCFARIAVISMPDGDERTCMVQTHDAPDDRSMIRYEFGNLIMRIGDPTVKTINGIALGSVHEYGIEIVDGLHRFWFDGAVVHEHSGFTGSGFYFKWGNYLQARKDRVTDLSDVGVLDLHDAIVWHSGEPTFAHTFAGVTLG